MLAIEEMDGGTFTISNGGVFGSLFGTPIINPPQSAILGMHATIDRPVAIAGKVRAAVCVCVRACVYVSMHTYMCMCVRACVCVCICGYYWYVPLV